MRWLETRGLVTPSPEGWLGSRGSSRRRASTHRQLGRPHSGSVFRSGRETGASWVDGRSLQRAAEGSLPRAVRRVPSGYVRRVRPRRQVQWPPRTLAPAARFMVPLASDARKRTGRGRPAGRQLTACACCKNRHGSEPSPLEPCFWCKKRAWEPPPPAVARPYVHLAQGSAGAVHLPQEFSRARRTRQPARQATRLSGLPPRAPPPQAGAPRDFS
jgi:hypothetical protein